MSFRDESELASKAFLNAQAFNNARLFVGFGELVHYSTCIATWNAAHTVVIVNDTYYTKTTRALQTTLKDMLAANQFNFVCVTNLPIDCSDNHVRAAYLLQHTSESRAELES
jgi:hypothetical protein